MRQRKTKPTPPPPPPPAKTTTPEERPLEHSFLWIDIATTGLDPRNDAILELGWLLADDAPGGAWTEVDSDAFTLHFDRARWDGQIHRAVQRMHDTSGLWADCERAPAAYDHRALDEYMCSVMQARGVPDGSRTVVVAGSSVHFDAAFLRRRCPRFADYLSHRVFDASTLRSLGRIVAPEWVPDVASNAAEHRALADIRYSLSVARSFVADIIVGGA